MVSEYAAAFDAPWYHEWNRSVYGFGAVEGTVLLHDSSIHEPADLLHQHIQHGYAADLRSRFLSTYIGHGNPRLIQAIARRYGVAESMVLTSTGCTAAIWLLYRTLLQPGDHILVESPSFDMLTLFAQERGVHVERLPRSPGGFQIDPERVRALLVPETRLVVLTNGHNPTSAALADVTLRAIADVVRPRGIPVLVDEVYGDFLPTAVRSGPAARLDPCFISINSLTKVYGLSALKCGWILCSPAILARLLPMHRKYEVNSSRITHGIGSLVLDELVAFTHHWQKVLATNRAVLAEAIVSLSGAGLLEGQIPEYGCMFFPRVVGVADTRHFAKWLWNGHRVVVAPGEFFDAPGHIRIGFGQPAATLASGLARLAEGLAMYRRTVQ